MGKINERFSLVPAFSLLCSVEPARLWVWFELGLMSCFVAVGLSVLGNFRDTVILSGLCWYFVTTDFKKSCWHKLGFVFGNSLNTFWVFEWAVFLSLIFWLSAMLISRKLYSLNGFFAGKAGYFIGALIQQIVMQSYFFVRLEHLFDCPVRATRWTEKLFCLAHFPNPVLMFMAFWGGRFSCRIFREHRNLFVLSVAHGVIGATMAVFLPSWTMRAGIGFVRFLQGH